jgi:hypothetical protein
LQQNPGYHIHAADGAIGHIENFLMEDKNWEIRYLIADTRNWWPGQHVLVSPYALTQSTWVAGKFDSTFPRKR